MDDAPPPPARRPLRIVSWNVGMCGLARTLANHSRPGHLAALLDSLRADVLCLQEVKNTRPELGEHHLLADGFTTFVSLNRSRSLYAGVATIVRDAACPAARVEEGVTGALGGGCGAGGDAGNAAAPPSSSPASSSSSAAPATAAITYTPLELDSEGRALMTDHGGFVLINTYCPAVTSDNAEEAARRRAFKRQFHAALRDRVAALHAAGRAVVVVGDLNVSHTRLDHCDPDGWVRGAGAPFEASEWRQWMTGMLAAPPPLPPLAAGATGGRGHLRRRPRAALDDADGGGDDSDLAATRSDDGGSDADDPSQESPPPPSAAYPTHLVDAFRRLHPTRASAFTCWNTASSARQTNYGTRLDYTLLSNTLVDAAAGEGGGGGIGSNCSTAAASALHGPRLALHAADIQQEFHGSDHCPVWVELAVVGSGDGDNGPWASASDAAVGRARQHATCANSWPEFAKRQASLKSLFGRQAAAPAASSSASAPAHLAPMKRGRSDGGVSDSGGVNDSDGDGDVSTGDDGGNGEGGGGARASSSSGAGSKIASGSSAASSGSGGVFFGGKAGVAAASKPAASKGSGKKGAGKKAAPSSSSSGAANSLFAMGFARTSVSASATMVSGGALPAASTVTSAVRVTAGVAVASSAAEVVDLVSSDDNESDGGSGAAAGTIVLASQTSDSDAAGDATGSASSAAAPAAASGSGSSTNNISGGPPASSSSSGAAAAAAGWAGLLKRLPPPTCACGQPAVQRVVKKRDKKRPPGTIFYVCAKPEGLRTDAAARCDFFMYHDAWEKAAARTGGGAGAGSGGGGGGSGHGTGGGKTR